MREGNSSLAVDEITANWTLLNVQIFLRKFSDGGNTVMTWGCTGLVRGPGDARGESSALCSSERVCPGVS